MDSAQPCKPLFGGAAPVLQNADMTEYAGKNAQQPGKPFPPDVYYPNGVEYRCKAGHSENGSPGGKTKITARVNTLGTFSPALPSGCLPITFTIRGKVKDAAKGRSLNGAQVTVSGNGHSKTVQTSNGIFVISGVKPGSVTLTYKKGGTPGYIDNSKTIDVSGDISTGGVADVSMSPKMASDQWRAVVKWNKKPSDLDTYAKWGWTKVCWYGRNKHLLGIRGKLEVDDTNGYGPETLYLTGVGTCPGILPSHYCDIKYIINDYTRSGRMKSISGAQVTLYTGSRVAGTWKIEGCQNSVSRDGNWWHVFTLDGATNKLKWSCNQGGGGDHGAAASAALLGYPDKVPNLDPPQAYRADNGTAAFSAHSMQPEKVSAKSTEVTAAIVNSTVKVVQAKKPLALLQEQPRVHLHLRSTAR